MAQPELLRRFWRSKSAMVGAVLMAGIVFVVVFASVIAPQNPYDLRQIYLEDSCKPPCWLGVLVGSSSTGTAAPESTGKAHRFLLGSDEDGRDVYSAILYGMRISLFVGISATLFSGVCGVFLGLAAGYYRGRLDTVIMRLADIQLSFPSILIAILLMAIWGSGLLQIIVAVVVVRWVVYARTIRGSMLAEREKEYVLAASALGASNRAIIIRHILPNIISPIIVISAVEIASVIMLESTLSYLGLGVPPTKPSLGMLIKFGYDVLLSGYWWISVFPGIALVMIVFAINLLGDWLRDTLNPSLGRALQ
jgi:peptide/nickel transport system permease protein